MGGKVVDAMGGLTRGLQLMADLFSIALLAARKSNAECLMDAFGVVKVWLGETVDTGGKVKIGAFTLLTGDPWKDSRSAFRALDQKWRGRI